MTWNEVFCIIKKSKLSFYYVKRINKQKWYDLCGNKVDILMINGEKVVFFAIFAFNCQKNIIVVWTPIKIRLVTDRYGPNLSENVFGFKFKVLKV